MVGQKNVSLPLVKKIKAFNSLVAQTQLHWNIHRISLLPKAKTSK